MMHIFRKELLQALLSGSFIVCFASSVALFALSTFFFVARHDEIPRASQAQVKPSTKGVLITKPLSRLGFCVHDAGASTGITPGSGGDLHFSEQERNFTLPSHVRSDWVFLVVVAFGITGIVFSYAAINGEKEDGTLALMLSHSIPRSSVFLGKYLALTAATAVPLLVGALIGLLVIEIFGSGGMVWADAGRIAVFLLFSGLFVSLIVLLSLFVSTITYRSAIAALILLATWAIWTFLIPGVSRLLVSKVSPLPSELETASRLGPMIKQEVWGRIDEIRKQVKAGELTSAEKVLKLSDEAFVEGQKKLVALRKEIKRTKEARIETFRNISRTSPAAAFRYGIGALLDMGFVGIRHFRQDAERYASIYDDYVISKMGKLVVTSDWSFSTSMRVGKENVHITSPQEEEYTGDMTDFPAFKWSQLSAEETLSEAMLDLVILFGWNIVLFAAGFVAFSRYDVR